MARISLALIGAALALNGCMLDSREQILKADEKPAETRAMQSRVFATADKTACLQAVVAALQSLGFVIDKVDPTLGVVTATTAQHGDIHITVSIQQQGAGQMLVRASGERYLEPVSEPEAYRQFFAVLEHSMALPAGAGD